MTNLELLSSAFPDYFQRICEERYSQYKSGLCKLTLEEYLAMNCNTPTDALFNAFCLNKSAEGWDYWAAIALGVSDA